MDQRYHLVTAVASTQFGAVSTPQLDRLGVGPQLRFGWIRMGLLERQGPRSFAIVGSPPTWERSAWAAAADCEGAGYLAGRTAARLHGLDGFATDDIEILVRRAQRSTGALHRVASTAVHLSRQDSVLINGIRCLTAERLILDAPLFAFSTNEIENAIDSSIRFKLIGEQRLRSKVVARHRRSINHGRTLLDALVDTGGESRLERWFLGIVRRAGLPRPQLQKIWRESSRTVARVDAFFPGDLVVELAGHANHATRRDRQRDEQRRTELTLLGNRVITFTHEDVRDRPAWVTTKLVAALARLRPCA